MELIQWYHVWLFMKVDAIGKAVNFITFLSCIGFVILCVGNFIEWSNSLPLYKKTTFCYLLWMLFIIPLNVIIPTQKEVAAIYLVPKIVNSDTAQTFTKEASGLPVEFVRLVKTKMDEWITESLSEQMKIKGKEVVKEAKEAAKETIKEAVKEGVK